MFGGIYIVKIIRHIVVFGEMNFQQGDSESDTVQACLIFFVVVGDLFLCPRNCGNKVCQIL